MTVSASGPTYRDGVESGFTMDLRAPEDVDALVDVLAPDYAFTASLECDRAVLEAHVQGDFGYLCYYGPEFAGAYTVGDPTSPEVTASETGFPAGTGIPLDTFRQAITEFMDTHRVPTCVHWKDHYSGESSLPAPANEE
jgi:anaerobic selenocysteine-containing dehydrogenase